MVLHERSITETISKFHREVGINMLGICVIAVLRQRKIKS